ncbi:MAG: hypothetical protein SNJ69_05875 [Chloroflexaceae bacterium]
MGRGVYVAHAYGRWSATSNGYTNQPSGRRANNAPGHAISGCAIGYGNPRANGNRRTTARNDDVGAAADRRADAACCYFTVYTTPNPGAGANAARNTGAVPIVACNARAGPFAPRNRDDRHGRAGPFTTHHRGASTGPVRYPARNG